MASWYFFNFIYFITIKSEINDRLTKGQAAQDENSNVTDSRDESGRMLDDIAQSLDEAKGTAETV